MDVIIYHNVERDGAGVPVGFFGYRPGHAVVAVFACTSNAATLPGCVDEMFRLFNVGDDPHFGAPDPRALAYRNRGLRSLSVGDVVGGGGCFLACEPLGWRPVQAPAVVVRFAHGTVPLAG